MGSTRSGDYSINMNANLDMSQAQKTLRDFESSYERQQLKIPFDVDVSNVLPKLDDFLNNQVATKIESSFERINTKLSHTTGTFEKYNKATGEYEEITKSLIQVTETFKNKIGDVQERVSLWTKDGEHLASSLENVKNGVEYINTTVETSIGKMGDYDARITEVTETLYDTQDGMKQVTTATTEWVDAQGRLYQEIRKFDNTGDHVSSTIEKISDDAKKAAKFTKELTNAINSLNKKYGVNRTETKTFIDANGVKTVTEYVNGVRQLTTETRQYTNSLRELVTETKVYEGEERKLVSVDEKKSRNVQQELQQEREQINARFDLREETIRLREEEERLAAEQERLNNALQNGLLSTTTTTSRGTVQQFGDDSGRYYEALITQIDRVDEANRRVIQTTYEFTNAQGQLVRQTRTTDAEGHKLAEDTIEISNANERASESNRRLANSTKEVTKAQNTMGGALSRALTTLTQYYLASLPIRAVRTAIQETITTLKDFDSALIEFRKVSDLAGESLTNYVAKLAEMGEITGSTMQAMVEAAT